MELMNSHGMLQQQNSQMEREIHQLRQGGNSFISMNQSMVSDVGSAASGPGLSEVQKAKFLEQIKTLESKLLKAQEGKISNTDQLLELTQAKSKLETENKDLTRQLTEFKDTLNEKEK